jgi:dolichol kinase
MAFGDGAATLAGTRIGGARLPWNPQKTWSGLAAFVVTAAVGAVALR